MDRLDIREMIGKDYFTKNLENSEFSYSKALKKVGKNINDYRNDYEKNHNYLDIRFESEKVVVLVEAKDLFVNWDKQEICKQLQQYVKYEKELTGKKIIAILAETIGNGVWTWFGQSVIIDDSHKSNIDKILTMSEYEDLYYGKINDKIKVVDSIRKLNEMLHTNGVNEKLRSQFVGTCLLAINNNLNYKNLSETIKADGSNYLPENQILDNIKMILSGLLSKTSDLLKAGKLSIIQTKVLDDADIRNLNYKDLVEILDYIEKNIIPYINDKVTAGQDLLNLFFTTFNKYVGKTDKNQAFTPDHICHFMSRVIGINKNSRVLDPCCGSGAFLVRALTDAMDDCDTETERDNVKSGQIFGIEFEEGAYGLSSTNMLIHGDGNSNVICANMFDKQKWIQDNKIDKVLMNPPYNATRKCCDKKYVSKWSASTKEDPSKGFHFVKFIAESVSKNCKIAVLLPLQCAIGNYNNGIKTFKEEILKIATLDAVFSLPIEMFYPGSTSVACCMVFDCSETHEKSDRETFFGYYRDDNFIKRKGLGRIEKTDSSGNSLWYKTEKLWLDLYKNKKTVPGLSVMKKVTAEDEWLAEAYMETDYNKLTEDDFNQSTLNYISYLIKTGDLKSVK